MSILNQAEIEAKLAANLPDNAAGEISPLDVRGMFQDYLDSLQSYGGVIADGVDTINVTTTPTKVVSFTYNATPTATPVLEADYLNSLIKVFEPARYEVTFRFQAIWSAVRELTLEIRLNGAANPVTPLALTQEGNGSDLALSWTAVTFIVNSAAIAAGPGGAYAEVELFASGDQSFSVTQNSITMGVAYSPLSIRTVG